jgi:hypothetical protein
MTWRAWAVLTSAAVASAGELRAQSIAARVEAVREGSVQLHFASRPGMCGDGEHVISMKRGQFISDFDVTRGGDWRERCLPGPVRVVLGVRDGRVYSVRRYVGPLPRRLPDDVRDLGEVSTRDAAAYLLALAPRLPGGAGEDAIEAAAFADGVTLWPELLPIARDQSIPKDTREAAMFWIAQAAAAATTGGEITGDDYSDAESVAEHAIFVLSELDHGEGIPDLIRIARSNPNPRLRARAIFWLGQTTDPRALGVLEEILRR